MHLLTNDDACPVAVDAYDWLDREPMYTDQVDRICEIAKAELALGRLATSSGDLFFRKDGHVLATPLGQTLQRHIPAIAERWAGRTHSHVQLSPPVELFLDRHFQGWMPTDTFVDDCLPERSNKAIGELRRALQSDAAIRAQKSRERTVRDRMKVLTNYFGEVFRICARPLVVRLDLGFPLEFRAGVTAFELRTSLARWLRLVRARFPTYIGYVWKIEYGAFKRFHVHTFLIFNGERSREDITMGQVAGGMWKDDVCDGRGSYWNCNANKADYARRGLLGIGEVHYHDLEKRANLLRAAFYLAKADYLIRVRAHLIKVTFHTSQLPTPSARTGRPRKWSIG